MKIKNIKIEIASDNLNNIDFSGIKKELKKILKKLVDEQNAAISINVQDTSDTNDKQIPNPCYPIPTPPYYPYYPQYEPLLPYKFEEFPPYKITCKNTKWSDKSGK